MTTRCGLKGRGSFAMDPQGLASVKVEQLPAVATIQAWAVIIEPAGGVP